MKTRQDRLVGIDGARLLRRAAIEMDLIGRRNARIAEVDAQAHTYEPSVRDVYYLERRLPSGLWEAEGVEDIAGQGVLSVWRELRENLEPAMRMQMVGMLVRGGVFNEFESAKDYVCKDCKFVCADVRGA
jgi:hypothetical protein